MTTNLFIGVDGGGTKCVVRLEDEAGRLLGREASGPANVRISVQEAWQSVNAALNKILQPLSLSINDMVLNRKDYRFHAGMGLAGCEMVEAYQAFINHSHPFSTLVVSADSHTACLGAHQGGDGAIIIAGTGVVGFQIQHGKTAKVGGWGFPHDDEGGGAWLGLQAVKMTLRWLDGRLPASALTRAVYDNFDGDHCRLISRTNAAKATQFAELAPIVIQHAQMGECDAIKLLQQAALAIDSIGDALEAAQVTNGKALSCSLVGGMTPFLEPHLGTKLRSRLRPCQSTPDAGAILLVRNYLVNETGKMNG